MEIMSQDPVTCWFNSLSICLLTRVD